LFLALNINESDFFLYKYLAFRLLDLLWES